MVLLYTHPRSAYHTSGSVRSRCPLYGVACAKGGIQPGYPSPE